MGKKNYKRPVVKNTKIDYSITLTQSSQDNLPGPPDTINPPNEVFINPLNWLKK